LLVLAAAVQAGRPAAPAKSPDPSVLATLDGVSITASEIEPIGGANLTQARAQYYQVQRAAIDEAINRRLIDKEAAARGISVADLLKQEVESKVAPVSPDEQRQIYEQNKARYFANVPEAEAMNQIQTVLTQQRIQAKRAEYAQTLRAKSNVRILLDPPRTQVSADDDPFKGPADAPVTIVEFSDFQCPFCSRVNPTLTRLRDRFGDSIRIVFRDLPIQQIHPQAAKAAEAASCANEQKKFWEMHDVLFANQQALDVPSLKKHAATIGLDAAAFEKCLDSGKYAADWQKDSADAAAAGVQSTPAFFINGRAVIGAQPYEAFADVVAEELGRLGRPVPPEKPVAAAPAPAPAPAASPAPAPSPAAN
jgi:protein-disulfide isomerase